MTHNIALITGASRGLGLALARTLAHAGWQLIINARGADSLEAVRSELAQHTEVIAIPGDVADPQHRAALAEAAQNLGSVAAIINNASILGPSPQPNLLDYPLHTLTDVYHTNVIAPLGIIQAMRVHLSNAATIINITSDAGVEAYPGWGGYGSSKAALEQLSAILAAENPEWRVYWVDPGDMQTQIINLRSEHTNTAHYTIASGFTVEIAYNAHTSTGCFAEVPSAGQLPLCPDYSIFDVTDQELNLRLGVSGTSDYTFEVGEQIPLIAEVEAIGAVNIDDTVRIELTVPRGLAPTELVIQNFAQNILDAIVQAILDFLGLPGQNSTASDDNSLGATVDENFITLTYDYDAGLVIGQPLPINLTVVGEVEGNFLVQGRAVVTNVATPLSPATEDASLQQNSSRSTLEANDTLNIRIAQSQTCSYSPGPGVTQNIRSAPNSTASIVFTANSNTTILPQYIGKVDNDSENWWLFVEVNGGPSGWISGTLFSAYPTAEEASISGNISRSFDNPLLDKWNCEFRLTGRSMEKNRCGKRLV